MIGKIMKIAKLEEDEIDIILNALIRMQQTKNKGVNNWMKVKDIKKGIQEGMIEYLSKPIATITIHERKGSLVSIIIRTKNEETWISQCCQRYMRNKAIKI